jgi:hypothetical protein
MAVRARVRAARAAVTRARRWQSSRYDATTRLALARASRRAARRRALRARLRDRATCAPSPPPARQRLASAIIALRMRCC